MFVKVNIVATNEIKSVSLQVTEKTTIDDLIKLSVDIFNLNFEKENLLNRINTNYSIYSIKPSKKKGTPDLDLPSKIKLFN